MYVRSIHGDGKCDGKTDKLLRVRNNLLMVMLYSNASQLVVLVNDNEL